MSWRAGLACLIGLLAIVVFAAAQPAPAEPPEGVRPVGADGKPLNLDFETGTLQDWTAEGKAFREQPIKGDTVFARRKDMKSQHQGQYWVGGFEKYGDKAQGTLTSLPFKITHPWASFLVGGGPHETTCVELVRKDTGTIVFRASGIEEEDLRRVVVDLKPHLGKDIYVQLIDRHNGSWGHVNFDDFRFHSRKPDFPARPVAAVQAPAKMDVFQHAGLPPEKAAEAMTVPEGFVVKLFAGEPDVHQPIAMCLDDRGRLWVAEAYCYPTRRKDADANDRILIFEDADGDGKFDQRTVFMEGLNLVSGLEVGFGGVWIGAAPYLLFVPLKEGEDKPAGKPQVLLDGWGYQDTHETLNSFIWGPDGWLYGCHGVFTHSKVGKPGTPDKDRVPINAGVWRYHPTRHVFEVFAHGTSNPWGLDFNDHGEAFVEACVIPHCFHIVPGGRYHRQAGQHFNPHTYADIQTIADHRHYLGANPHGGNNKSDAAGGGHAHCGLMCYLGGAWPEEYRGRLFMGNIHGRRINTDILKPKGSGYVASHGPDFLLANDAWARFINFRYGPDGNVYVIDWYDKQACHSNQANIWDRTNGRIYKVCYRGTKTERVDLSKKSDKELVELQLHPNDWYVRHARRLLQERVAKTGPGVAAEAIHQAIHSALGKIALEHKDETRRLRAMWALHVTGGLTTYMERLLKDESPHVRGWVVRLAAERNVAQSVWYLQAIALAKTDPSPIYRLHLASALPRMGSPGDGLALRDLVAHGEDAGDHNLPLMYWYAAEPLVSTSPPLAETVLRESKVPLVRTFLARRLAAMDTPAATTMLLRPLTQSDDGDLQRAVLRGLQEGLKGRRQVAMPELWPAAYARIQKSKDAEVRSLASSVAVTFGDTRALDEMRKLLMTADADATARQNALATLLGVRDPRLVAALQKLVADPVLRGPAIRGLASYDDPKTPAVLLEAYKSLSAAEKRDVLNTLSSRTAYGKALLEAVGKKQITAAEVPAEIVRQMRNLNDKEIDRLIGEVWGVVRTTPAERVKLIAQHRGMLLAPAPPPDLSMGRAVFAKACQQCHTLYGVGNKVGPDITGSNRADLNYLLENMLDPSAVIQKEYAATQVALKGGRVVTGIVKDETPAALTVVTANETLTLPKADIEAREQSASSMMPDDLLKPLKPDELRALVAYLQYPVQVPLLATADNAKDFFNGKDLASWDGDPKLWSVENGEIVGKSPGLKKNEFLKSHLTAGDFRLTLKVKLTPNKENSGVQFRSEALKDGDVKGYQADVGAGWWGKLYEEHGRGLLWDKSGEAHVKADDWNEYAIEAVGSRVRTFINGKPCVDLDDPKGAKRGIFALQIHSGGPMEVRFKDIKLEVNHKEHKEHKEKDKEEEQE